MEVAEAQRASGKVVYLGLTVIQLVLVLDDVPWVLLVPFLLGYLSTKVTTQDIDDCEVHHRQCRALTASLGYCGCWFQYSSVEALQRCRLHLLGIRELNLRCDKQHPSPPFAAAGWMEVCGDNL